MVGTAGAHVEDTPPHEESTATPICSGEATIIYRCCFWEATEQSSLPTRSIEDILGAHLIGDTIWGGTNQSNVSIDTANSKEVMTGSHITEQHIFKYYQRQTMLQTMQQIQQLPIPSTKKIKTTTIKGINNILVTNMKVVQKDSTS